MEYKEEIIELLKEYIDIKKNDKKKYEELFTKKALYEELINVINVNYEELINNRLNISLLLNAIYDNENIYIDFFKTLLLTDETEKEIKLNNFKEIIINDYNNLCKDLNNISNKIKRVQNTISSANRVILCFKQDLPILEPEYDVKAVKRILSYFELDGRISNREELLYMNEIEQYNRLLLTKKESNVIEEKHAKKLHDEVPNIINAGYETFTLPRINDRRSKTLDKLADEVLKTKKGNPTMEEIINSLEVQKNHTFNDEEYKYIIIKTIIASQNEIYSFYELLIDKDTYHNIKDRKEMIECYYNELNFFLSVRKYYDAFCEKKESAEDIKEELVEEEKEIEEIHRLIYSTSDVNPTKSKFIADLDDIPQEYYVTVYYLINGFKTGTLSVGEYKALTNNNNVQKCRELKSDQVRIILKHVKDNIYVILGAATKKVDNDKKMYESMAKRSIPKIDTDNALKLQLLFAEQVEKELTTIVESKGRKGNR